MKHLILILLFCASLRAEELKRVVYVHDDNSVSILSVMPEEFKKSKKTQGEVINDEMTKRKPKDCKSSVVVEVSDLPRDRKFRDAWRWSGNKVVVDLSAARNLIQSRTQKEADSRIGMVLAEVKIANDSGKLNQLAAKKAAIEQIRETDFSKMSLEELAAFKPNWP